MCITSTERVSWPLNLKLPIFKVVSTIGKNMGSMNCYLFFKETSDLPSLKFLTGVHFHYNFIASLKLYVMSLEHAKNGCMHYNVHQVSTLNLAGGVVIYVQGAGLFRNFMADMASHFLEYIS